MATITLSPQKGWAVGETISAYVASPANVITGNVIDTAVVAADSTTTFDVPAGQSYIATDGATEVRFSTLTDAKKQNAKGVAMHSDITGDGDGYPARPPGYASVEWIGPDDPATEGTAIDGDTWVPTA